MSGESTSPVPSGGPKVSSPGTKKLISVSSVKTPAQAQKGLENNFIFSAMFNTRWDMNVTPQPYKTDNGSITITIRRKVVVVVPPGILIRNGDGFRALEVDTLRERKGITQSDMDQITVSIVKPIQDTLAMLYPEGRELQSREH